MIGAKKFTRRVGRSRRVKGGFTLIELAIAMSILMIGLISAAAATMRMHELRRQNRERIAAQNAVRSIGERIHAQAYRFSDDPDTWGTNLTTVFGPGGTFGDEFAVPLLTSTNPGTTNAGIIQIITDETTTDAALGFELGLPRDLNGDGDADDTDVTLDARILPVLVSVNWRSQSGASSVDHGFYVMGY